MGDASLHVDIIKCALHQVFRLPNYIISIYYLIFPTIVICFLNCVHPNPPCQPSLWEETGAPGENPRLSAVRALTDSFHKNP